MAVSFVTIFKHLLPKARAWNITYSKPLRWFFDGCAGMPARVRAGVDLVWGDLFATTTRFLDDAERMWGLPSTPGLTESQRRTRLLARKREAGGQSPRYIEDTLQAAGFNVFVHEWFAAPAQVPPIPAVPRDPRLYLAGSNYQIRYYLACGEPLAQCGEPLALCGETIGQAGYLLVNKLTRAIPDVFVACGEPLAQCGEPSALCGNFDKFIWVRKIYSVPDDPAQWPYVLYIGGQVFGDLATVPNARRDEFEDMVLRICPGQQWLGILVSYN